MLDVFKILQLLSVVRTKELQVMHATLRLFCNSTSFVDANVLEDFRSGI